MKSVISCFYIILISLLLNGCTHIPKESVVLSEELTNMIISARESHLAMIDEYMAERRQKADKFLEEKWVPDFMAEFVAISGIIIDLDSVETISEKTQLIKEFTEAAAQQIFERRTTLMDNLDSIEQLLREAIINHYSQMLLVNKALTAHLRSAAKVTETRTELLKQVQIEPTEILPMGKITKSIEKLLTFEDELDKLPSIVNEVETIINGEK